MIVYQNNALGFRNEVDDNVIVDEIEQVFKSKLGQRVSKSERTSWQNSLRFMETAIRKSGVPDDCGVLIEFNIPSTSKRVDFIISGHDEENNANFVIIELKQWQEACATDKEDVVTTTFSYGKSEVTHPSYQAYSYKRYLTDMNESIYKKNIKPYSCAYLHNYRIKDPEPLYSSQYSKVIKDTPIFFTEDAKKLQAFINKYVGKGKGLNILYEIENGKIKPSKKLVEYVSSMFEDNEVYTLLDEQKVAYSNIVKYANTSEKKMTIIVKGGPGTGKSVVAMNSFVEILKHGKNIRFVAPNASFRTVIVDMLSKDRSRGASRINALFSGSGAFYNEVNDKFDMLIVDEAHRLKKKGSFMYRGQSQVEDVVRASKVNVFFIDDNQRIRPDDEGSVERIKDMAFKYDSEVIEIELEAQFRCAGAEGYINWLDHNLQIKKTANYNGWEGDEFEFFIMNSPQQLHDRINEKVEEGYNARMLAGFAWPWTNEGNPDADIPDVSIPEHNFEMPWNSKKNQNTWAIENEKQNQIGCVHTSQGLEFDYVGVIIGNDLRFNIETYEIYASYEDYYDKMGKRGLRDNPEELTKLVKNIYKVLMSRGMKGCYVFCRDENLQKHFKSRLSSRNYR